MASTYFRIPVNADNQVDLPVVPIGKPVYNTQIYILNRFREHCMPGVPGELYIGGMGVSRGYHNKPEKNAEAFVPNPFNPVSYTHLAAEFLRRQGNDGGDAGGPVLRGRDRP